MSYPDEADDMDDGTENDYLGPGALSSVGGASAPVDTAGLGVHLQKSLAENDALLKSFGKRGQAYDPRAVAQGYDDMAKRLRERSAGPSSAEKLAAISAGFLQPTKYKGFGALFSNVSPVLQEIAQRQREGQDANLDQSDKLRLKAMEAEGEGYNQVLTQRDRLLKMLTDKYKQDNRPQYKMVPDGMGGFNYLPMAPTPGASPQPQASLTPRPQGVPPDWQHMTDKNGAGAWVSPDGKQILEDKN